VYVPSYPPTTVTTTVTTGYPPSYYNNTFNNATFNGTNNFYNNSNYLTVYVEVTVCPNYTWPMPTVTGPFSVIATNITVPTPICKDPSGIDISILVVLIVLGILLLLALCGTSLPFFHSRGNSSLSPTRYPIPRCRPSSLLPLLSTPSSAVPKA
jgi:hypothetical protein